MDRDGWKQRIEIARAKRIEAGGALIYHPEPEWEHELFGLYLACERIFWWNASEAKEELISLREKPGDRRLLLFALAAVAYQHGSANRLWPEVRAKLVAKPFRDEFTDSDFQQTFAPLFTDLWQDEVSDSAGRLLVPRRGKRHIKWPLAHAGLTAQERSQLEDFAEVLVTQFGVEATESVFEASVGEFTDILRDWLRGGSGAAHVGLASNLGDERFNALAELGLQYLRSQGAAAFTQDEPKVDRRPVAQLIRRQLVFDQRARQLRIRLTGGSFEPLSQPRLDWDGAVLTLRTRTTRVGNRLLSTLDCDLPVRADWSGEPAKLLKGDGTEATPITMPARLAETPIGWFDHATGVRSYAWEEGKTYLAVRNPDLTPSWPGRLFKSVSPWRSVDVPGLRLVAADVCASSLAEVEDEAGGFRQLVEILESEGADVDINSLRRGREPHVVLTSGIPIEHLGGEAFPTWAPPQIELRGTWTGEVPVVARRFGQSETVMVRSGTPGPVVMRITDPTPGLVEITFGGRRQPVMLVTHSGLPTRPSASLTARAMHTDLGTVIEGEAWSLATIVVRPFDGTVALGTTRAGEDGSFRLDLAFEVTTSLVVLADGIAEVVLESQRLRVIGWHRADEDIRIEVSDVVDLPGLDVITVGESPCDLAVTGARRLPEDSPCVVRVRTRGFVSSVMGFRVKASTEVELLFAIDVAPVRERLLIKHLVARGFWSEWLPYAKAATARALPEAAAVVVAAARAGAVCHQLRGSAAVGETQLQLIELLVAAGEHLTAEERALAEPLVEAFWAQSTEMDATVWIHRVTSVASVILGLRDGSDCSGALEFARAVEANERALLALVPLLGTATSLNKAAEALPHWASRALEVEEEELSPLGSAIMYLLESVR